MTKTSLGILVVLLAGVARAGDETVVKGDVGAKLDRAVQTTSRGGFWGTVLVAKGGEVLLAKGYGNADYATVPNTSTSLYEIASVSKMFTASAILKLEAQGKLKLTDTLGGLFENVPEEKKGITIRHLLSHTSGISPRFALPYAAKETKEEFLAKILAEPLESDPGDHFEYCNAGYALLAAIVEKASGASFEQYVRDEIFKPAGMTDTGFIKDEALDRKRATARLRDSEIDGTAADWHWSWGYRGMGGVVTTAWDLYRFDRALRDGKPLDAATQRKQATPEKENAGLGCFVDKTPRGTTRLSHTGAVAGYHALYARYLEDDLVVVILSNEACELEALEKGLLRVIFPPPTVSIAVDLSNVKVKDGVLPRGTKWKASKVEAGVVLEIVSGEASPAKLTFPLESAKALVSQLASTIESKETGKNHLGFTPDMESGIYTGAYEVENGKLERGSLSFMVLPKYMGMTKDGRPIEDSRLTFVVVDESRGFWPVVVKMNLAAAKALKKDVDEVLAK